MKIENLTVRKIKKITEERETEDSTKYSVELSNDDYKVVITTSEILRGFTLKDCLDVDNKNPQTTLDDKSLKGAMKKLKEGKSKDKEDDD